MYKVRVRSDFSGAHNLRGYKGKCEELHGHNWYVEAEVRSDKLDESGMVVDFKDLKAVLEDIIPDMDHNYLNKMEYFLNINPTSENIARYVFENLSKKRPDFDLDNVTVWETNSSSATYSL